jgi:hypothetical protein
MDLMTGIDSEPDVGIIQFGWRDIRFLDSWVQMMPLTLSWSPKKSFFSAVMIWVAQFVAESELSSSPPPFYLSVA